MSAKLKKIFANERVEGKPPGRDICTKCNGNIYRIIMPMVHLGRLYTHICSRCEKKYEEVKPRNEY